MLLAWLLAWCTRRTYSAENARSEFLRATAARVRRFHLFDRGASARSHAPAPLPLAGLSCRCPPPEARLGDMGIADARNPHVDEDVRTFMSFEARDSDCANAGRCGARLNHTYGPPPSSKQNEAILTSIVAKA